MSTKTSPIPTIIASTSRPIIALFGTNTSINLGTHETQWLRHMKELLLAQGLTSYEPSTETLAERRIDLEIDHLRYSENMLFNIGTQGGDVTLAELRLVMWFILTEPSPNRTVLINIEPTNTDIFKSRRTLLSDLTAFQNIAKEFNIPLDLTIYEGVFDPEKFTLILKDIVNKKAQKNLLFEPIQVKLREKNIQNNHKRLVLSGPLNIPEDIVLRERVKSILGSKNFTVLDTHNPDYDSDPQMGRLAELKLMAGNDQIIIVNPNSISKFGPAFMASLMAGIYGQHSTFIIPSVLVGSVAYDSFIEHIQCIRSLNPTYANLFTTILYTNQEDLVKQLDELL